MITNAGKNILAKYLIGQAPAYASHLAIGCGAKPKASDYTFTNDDIAAYSAKKTLDFEMLRIPIISRGYVNESGIPKIVFTAEMPTTERYEISEVGVYSSGTNPSAGLADSRPLFVFSQGENWEYHGSGAASAIPNITEELSASHDPLVEDDVAIIASNRPPVFSTNADNKTLSIDSRIAKYEIPRYFNNAIFMRGEDANLGKSVSVTAVSGDGTNVTYTTALPHTLQVGDIPVITGISQTGYNTSDKAIVSKTSTTFTTANTTTTAYTSGGSVDTNHFIVNTGSHHIHLTKTTVDLSRNLPKDQIKLAFSIVNRDGTTSTNPSKARVMVEFASTDDSTGSFARFEAEITHSTSSTPTAVQQNLITNRYVVSTKELQELYVSDGFTWSGVKVVKIYSTVFNEENAPTDAYYVALDAIRLENVSSLNPLYGLTGYSVIKNSGSRTIVKLSNTTSLVEFRFALNVSST